MGDELRRYSWCDTPSIVEINEEVQGLIREEWERNLTDEQTSTSVVVACIFIEAMAGDELNSACDRVSSDERESSISETHFKQT